MEERTTPAHVIRGHLETAVDREGKAYYYFVRDGERLRVVVCEVCQATRGEPCRTAQGTALGKGVVHAARTMW